jgi:hypothetical protein
VSLSRLEPAVPRRALQCGGVCLHGIDPAHPRHSLHFKMQYGQPLGHSPGGPALPRFDHRPLRMLFTGAQSQAVGPGQRRQCTRLESLVLRYSHRKKRVGLSASKWCRATSRASYTCGTSCTLPCQARMALPLVRNLDSIRNRKSLNLDRSRSMVDRSLSASW